MRGTRYRHRRRAVPADDRALGGSERRERGVLLRPPPTTSSCSTTVRARAGAARRGVGRGGAPRPRDQEPADAHPAVGGALAMKLGGKLDRADAEALRRRHADDRLAGRRDEAHGRRLRHHARSPRPGQMQPVDLVGAPPRRACSVRDTWPPRCAILAGRARSWASPPACARCSTTLIRTRSMRRRRSRIRGIAIAARRRSAKPRSPSRTAARASRRT